MAKSEHQETIDGVLAANHDLLAQLREKDEIIEKLGMNADQLKRLEEMLASKEALLGTFRREHAKVVGQARKYRSVMRGMARDLWDFKIEEDRLHDVIGELQTIVNETGRELSNWREFHNALQTASRAFSRPTKPHA